jgi:hypothetical protein
MSGARHQNLPSQARHSFLQAVESLPIHRDHPVGFACFFAGLSGHYTSETLKDIPAQWQRFGPYIGTLPGQIGRVAYGVCFNMSDDAATSRFGFRYNSRPQINPGQSFHPGLLQIRRRGTARLG